MQVCSTCQKPKAALTCGLCEQPVCKNCAQFLDENEVGFLPKLSPVLSLGTYCTPCYDEKVAPELANYHDVMERAREMHVFMRNQSKETRLMKRSPKPFRVEACEDREETLLRLAFLAALEGYNAIIDVDISSDKVRNAGYQTSVWKGSAFGANLDPGKLPPPDPGSPN